MTSQLKASVDKLYTVFSEYEGNLNMQGSPIYANLEIWNKKLFSKPLRDLNATDLCRFTGKAMTTWGNVNDFKHFLPRIFELTAQLDTPYEIWVAFEKLEYGGWHSWEDVEKEIVLQYMISLWDSLLKDGSEEAQGFFQDYFSAIAYFYPSFNDLLLIWEKDTSKTAIFHLANFIFQQRENIFDKGFLEGFYRKTEHIENLKNWLLSDQIMSRLEKAFFRFEDERYSDTISWAEKILTDEKRNKAQNCNYHTAHDK